MFEQEKQSLSALSNYALDIAKKEGAYAAKVGASASTAKRLVFETNEYTLANSLDSQSIGIGVHKEQKKGSSSTNLTTEASVAETVKNALELASFGIPDDALNFASPEIAPKAKALDFLWDEALLSVDFDEMRGMMEDILQILRKDKRIALDRFELGLSVSFSSMQNSLGVQQCESQTVLSYSYLGMARDQDQVSGMDYSGGFSFSKKGFLEEAKKESEVFVQKLIKQLNPQKCPSYKGPILLSPRAVQEILIGNLLYHASGRSVMDGKSRWEKSLGKAVVSSKLSIVDRPHDPKLMGATAYDGDGIPTKNTTIINAGVLDLFLLDCYSAKKLKMQPNGTNGTPFSMHVLAGQENFKDMCQARNEILYVDRFSGNADPLTGDFSGVVKGGRLYKDGQDVSAVTETMIAGNVFELAYAILGVSSQAEKISGHSICPSFLVDGVSVSGV